MCTKQYIQQANTFGSLCCFPNTPIAEGEDYEAGSYQTQSNVSEVRREVVQNLAEVVTTITKQTVSRWLLLNVHEWLQKPSLDIQAFVQVRMHCILHFFTHHKQLH